VTCVNLANISGTFIKAYLLVTCLTFMNHFKHSQLRNSWHQFSLLIEHFFKKIRKILIPTWICTCFNSYIFPKIVYIFPNLENPDINFQYLLNKFYRSIRHNANRYKSKFIYISTNSVYLHNLLNFRWSRNFRS
jgi:hypothetical protein